MSSSNSSPNHNPLLNPTNSSPNARSMLYPTQNNNLMNNTNNSANLLSSLLSSLTISTPNNNSNSNSSDILSAAPSSHNTILSNSFPSSTPYQQYLLNNPSNNHISSNPTQSPIQLTNSTTVNSHRQYSFPSNISNNNSSIRTQSNNIIESVLNPYEISNNPSSSIESVDSITTIKQLGFIPSTNSNTNNSSGGIVVSSNSGTSNSPTMVGSSIWSNSVGLPQNRSNYSHSPILTYATSTQSHLTRSLPLTSNRIAKNEFDDFALPASVATVQNNNLSSNITTGATSNSIPIPNNNPIGSSSNTNTNNITGSRNSLFSFSHSPPQLALRIEHDDYRFVPSINNNTTNNTNNDKNSNDDANN